MMVGSLYKLYFIMKKNKEDGTLTDLGTVPAEPLDVVTADNTEDDVDVLIKKAMKNNKGEDALSGGYRVDNKPDGTLYVENPDKSYRITIEGDDVYIAYHDTKIKPMRLSLDFCNAINYLIQAKAGDAQCQLAQVKL